MCVHGLCASFVRLWLHSVSCRVAVCVTFRQQVSGIFNQDIPIATDGPSGSFVHMSRFFEWLHITYPHMMAGLLFPALFGVGRVCQTVLIPFFGFGARELVRRIVSDPQVHLVVSSK